jgi:hypothetical protein
MLVCALVHKHTKSYGQKLANGSHSDPDLILILEYFTTDLFPGNNPLDYGQRECIRNCNDLKTIQETFAGMM